MAIIQKQKATGRLLPVAYKLPQRTLQLLQQYSRFIESTQVYVITESLELAFKYPEFQEWIKHNPPLPKQTKARTPKSSASEPKPALNALAPDLTKAPKTVEKR